MGGARIGTFYVYLMHQGVTVWLRQMMDYGLHASATRHKGSGLSSGGPSRDKLQACVCMAKATLAFLPFSARSKLMGCETARVAKA